MSAEFPDRLRRAIDAGRVKADDPYLKMLESGVCTCCGKPGTVRQQSTCYYDEIHNWIIACDSCAGEIDAYWEEMWHEYYSGRL